MKSWRQAQLLEVIDGEAVASQEELRQRLVTRGIEAKLPWLNGADNGAGRALQAAGLRPGEAIDSKDAFTRK